jgi:flagellin-like protein
MIFGSKKGVSPLIATILLIAFAVALGSVIMNWGLNLSLGKSDDLCSSVEFKLRKIESADVCYGGFGANGYINFIVDNTGKPTIDGLSLWIIGEKDRKIIDVDDISLKSGFLYDKRDTSIGYDFNAYGKIDSIQIIPKINSDGSQKLCTKNAVEAQKIGICGN